jgi:hypothetical protein
MLKIAPDIFKAIAVKPICSVFLYDKLVGIKEVK